jgi:hypothetical protein
MHRFTIEAISQVEMQAENGAPKAQLLSNSIHLNLSKNLIREAYFGEDDLPNREGNKAILAGFIAGITSVIKAGHAVGHWNENEVLKDVSEKLMKGHMSNAEITEDKIKPLE